MIGRRSFLLYTSSAAALATCLSGPAPLRAETKFIPITGDAEDPHYTEPYIDIEEWRDEPLDVPSVTGDTTQNLGLPPVKVRHLYVHGGFKGNDTKFTFFFPPKDQYQGRFYQATHQLMTNENAPAYNVAMTLSAGAYCVQTNMGGSEMARTAEDSLLPRIDHSIGNYRANAAAAKYSRVVAQRVYGTKDRPRGYLYGGSGGAHQVVDSAQNTSGVWDGFMPYVMGNPVANPSHFLVRAHALRVLKDKWPSIMDAFEPGGGDPYAGLNPEETLALEDATHYGFPPRAWFNYVPQGTGPFGYVAAYVPLLDPTYVKDFWTKPGYITPSSSAKAKHIQSSAKVVRVIDAPATGARSQFMVGTQLELSAIPSGDVTHADVIGASGESKGMSAPLGVVKGNVISFALGANAEIVRGFKVGDTVTIDNSEYLAIQTYYRSSLPKLGSVFDFPPVYAYFRNADGSPKYPQRDILVGLNQQVQNLDIPQGKINGKMIVLQSLMDGDALPWEAAWYETKVRDAMGAAYNDTYRIYYNDYAQHSRPLNPLQNPTVMTHVISYQGILEQALRDLSAWVERGVAPPPSTNYTVKDGQVHVPPNAADRKGIQPVPTLTVNGQVRAEVGVGKPVKFSAVVEAPPNTGKIITAEWDFEGTGKYPDAGVLTPTDASGSRVTVEASHTFSRPGTYFAAIRVTSQREGNTKVPFALAMNLARMRIVVT